MNQFQRPRAAAAKGSEVVAQCKPAARLTEAFDALLHAPAAVPRRHPLRGAASRADLAVRPDTDPFAAKNLVNRVVS